MRPTTKGVIHIKDAITLLEAGYPCDLRLWKLSTGDILHYRGAVCIGGHWRRGTHRARPSQRYASLRAGALKGSGLEIGGGVCYHTCVFQTGKCALDRKAR